MVLERKEGILVILEAVLQFDKKTDDPYVEIETEDQKFERKDIEIGISDGLKVEVISGITEDDKIKVWNKTEPLKIGDEDEEEEDQDN